MTVWNRRIAVFRTPYGAFSPYRATSAAQRIEALPIHALGDPIESREVSDGQIRGVLISGGQGPGVLFAVLEGDVDSIAGQTLEEAARRLSSGCERSSTRAWNRDAPRCWRGRSARAWRRCS